jgi:hypothetical protein
MKADVWGLALYPFILINKRIVSNPKTYRRTLNHERIHHAQQLELLILPFYIWYVLEYLIYLVITRNSDLAYRSIRFERECYKHEKDQEYLANRRPYNYVFG